MGSSTGQLFRITTFGESHGPALGGIVEGCPPNIEVDPSMIQADLDRRKAVRDLYAAANLCLQSYRSSFFVPGW